jgi:hypothetical protein
MALYFVDCGAMQDLLTHPLVYRFWRLRRLAVVALALPAAALLGLAAITEGKAFLLQGAPLLVLLVFWIVALVGLLIRYPRAAGEVIICALTVCGLILLSPLAEWLAAREGGPLGGANILGLFLITLFAAAVVFLLACVFVNWLCKVGPRPQLGWAVIHRTDLPAATAYAALKPVPNSSKSWLRYGPADANGRFSARFTRSDLLPRKEHATADLRDDAPSYWVEVTEHTPLSCSTILVIPDGRTEAIHLTVHPDGDGARIVLRATHNVLTLWVAFIIYLTDFNIDHMIATLDEASDRTPVRAIWLLPLDSLTLRIERTFGKAKPR